VGLALFTYFDISEGILASMIIYMCFFQAGMGSLAFVHAFETCHPSLVGFMSTIMFTALMIVSFLGIWLINDFGVAVAFAWFAAQTFLGLLFCNFFLKDTTFKVISISKVQTEVNDPDEMAPSGKEGKIHLTHAEKQELYWPDEFKTK
jgi:hypothetical protein